MLRSSPAALRLARLIAGTCPPAVPSQQLLQQQLAASPACAGSAIALSSAALGRWLGSSCCARAAAAQRATAANCTQIVQPPQHAGLAGLPLHQVLVPGSAGQQQQQQARGYAIRRVNVRSPHATGAPGAAAAAGQGGAGGEGGAGMLEMGKEVPGGAKPLRTWEKWYWGLGVTSIALMLYKYNHEPPPTPEEAEEKRRRHEELTARRKDHIRTVLMGSSFVEGESDPFEGLSPGQIVLFMEKYGIDPSDPLEGMTPDEIDAYMQQQEERRRAERGGDEA